MDLLVGVGGVAVIDTCLLESDGFVAVGATELGESGHISPTEDSALPCAVFIYGYFCDKRDDRVSEMGNDFG